MVRAAIPLISVTRWPRGLLQRPGAWPGRGTSGWQPPVPVGASLSPSAPRCLRIRRSPPFDDRSLKSAAPALASDAAGPDPSGISIRSISYSGSGCPHGSVGTSFSNDRTSFTLIFDSFVASFGPGVPATERRKRCDFDLELSAPAGWSWAVVRLDSRGYVQLPAGVRARTITRLSSENSATGSHDQTGVQTFEGPSAKDYLTRTETLPLGRDWSKCGGIGHLRVSSIVMIDAVGGSAGPAQISIDSLDGKMTQGTGPMTHGFRLKWQRCRGQDGHEE